MKKKTACQCKMTKDVTGHPFVDRRHCFLHAPEDAKRNLQTNKVSAQKK